jgi:prepilin-type N-terminal cleavage/methylation domain-containing protein
MRLRLPMHFSQSGKKHSAAKASFLPAHGKRAFTLAEMLVVIAIIAIISTIAIPAMKGLTESNTMTSASRQMLDDLAFARQKAISGRTKVYMVFIPPEFWLYQDFNLLGTESRKQADTLIKGQYTSYSLFSERSIGDQPGQSSPRYLTAWRTLPEGVMIGARKFQPYVSDAASVEIINDPPQYGTGREFRIHPFSFRRFPFPPAELTNSSPVRVILPYIAFDSTGGILDDENESVPPMFQHNKSTKEPHEIIPLARGSIIYPTDSNGKPLQQTPDVQQRDYSENYNLIRIDKLTGRAKLERMELP